MQTLFKTVLFNIKPRGLNANLIKYNFGRAGGARQKKSFQEAFEQKKEIIMPEKEEKINEIIEDPEDFKEYDDLPIAKANHGFENDNDVSEYNELVEHESEQEILDPELRYQTFDKETKKFVKDELLYAGYDPHPEKLVQRPVKDVVWGLGGQLLRRKAKFFQLGRMPDPEEVIAFLEMEHGKDVSLVDLLEYNRIDLPRWGIVVTGYSSRHLHRMATSLAKSIKDLQIPGLINPPRVDGRRDDEWIMVSWKDFMIHMFTEESRSDLDLENKWKSADYEDDMDQKEELEKLHKQRKVYQGYKGQE